MELVAERSVVVQLYINATEYDTMDDLHWNTDRQAASLI